MPLPKDVQFVTFDCYGTLIDWETGVYDAFQKEADRDGFTIDRDALVPRFIEIQREIQSGSYELYAEVLRRTAVRVAGELGWELESSRAQFLPDSVPRWMPFRETNAQLERFAKKFETGDPVEHRRQAARGNPAPLPQRLRPGGHRAAGAQLQARPGPLQGVRAADREEEAQLGPRGQRLPHRRGPLPEVQGRRDLGQPPRRAAGAGREEAHGRGQDAPRGGQAAQGRCSAAAMRAVSVHEDAVVVTSLYWQTTATAIRAGDEAMLVDSPYFPDELELLPTVLAQSGFEPAALLATHGDFDHLLGRMAFPELSLGVAESTMLALPGEARGGAAPPARLRLGDLRAASPPARPRSDAVATRPGQARPGRAGAGAASRRGSHPGRDGGPGAVAGGAVRGRLPQRRGDPVAGARPARSRTTAPRWRGSHPWSSAPT